jgi:hypothetical protein
MHTPTPPPHTHTQVLCSLLRRLIEVAGAEEASRLWRATGLTLQQFMPEPDRGKSSSVQSLIEKYKLIEVLG